jgi:M6 family metalloprotease-like protein
MGIDYGYETKLMNPELCRFEKEEACQEMDQALQSQAHRTLQMVKTTGQLKVLVILVQFDNHKDRDMVDFMDLTQLFNAEGKGNDIVPTGSVKSYLRINSHDTLAIDATVVPWVKVPDSEQDCLFGNNGLDKRFQECFKPVMDLLDQLHVSPGNPFSWDDYDLNHDGFLDSVVVMHSGYGAEWGGTDPDGAAAEDRIWSHSIGPQEDTWRSPSFLVELGTYCVTSAFRGNEAGGIARIGTIVHEMIHTFGIPDLFDLSRSDQGGGVGSYSIMSDAWGQGNDPTYPGHLDPWSKIKLGWVTPKRITSSATYKMQPSETKPDIYMIDGPYPEGEYLLIENRQALHYDHDIWTGGALIWHIDDSVYLNTKAGGRYQGDEWPANGDHYQVALVQADGLFELERNTNKGHADDFYTEEGQSLEPGNGGTVYPNTDAYQGGQVVPTGVTITGFKMAGLQMWFTVKGLPEEASAALPGNPPLAPGSPPDPFKCIVNVNLDQCSGQNIQNVVQQDGCDCYNFCGNGVGQSCSAFGEASHINCHAGGLIAGCTIDKDSGTRVASRPEAEFLTPVSDILKPGPEVLEVVGVIKNEPTGSDGNSVRGGSIVLSFGLIVLSRLLR